MRPTPHLTPAEFELMEILWAMGEGSVQEVLDRRPPRRNLAYTTVMTVLDKMRKKGILNRRKRGKAFLYSPVPSRDQALASVVEHLIENYFHGSRSEFLEYMTRGTTSTTRPAPPVAANAPSARAAASTTPEAPQSPSMDEFLL